MANFLLSIKRCFELDYFSASQGPGRANRTRKTTAVENLVQNEDILFRSPAHSLRIQPRQHRAAYNFIIIPNEGVRVNQQVAKIASWRNIHGITNPLIFQVKV